MQHITCWNKKNPKTSSTSKEQHPCLTYSPPEALEQRQTTYTCRKFYSSKDELCEVDVQAKVANIQAQSIIHQTCSKPAKWQRYIRCQHRAMGADLSDGLGVR